jgi:hypothetical protein
MKAIDRVMRAYLNTRKLTEDEALRVRAELSKFIDELMSGKLMSGKTMSGKTMSGATHIVRHVISRPVIRG